MKNPCSGIKVDGGCKAFALTGRKGVYGLYTQGVALG